jgi:hypothetical protein
VTSERTSLWAWRGAGAAALLLIWMLLVQPFAAAVFREISAEFSTEDREP